MGGSRGSCLALRAEEDVTEEERGVPSWRWPLAQDNMTVKKNRRKPARGKKRKIEEPEKDNEHKTGMKRMERKWNSGQYAENKQHWSLTGIIFFI